MRNEEIEDLLDIYRELLLDYNFGSDSPRLCYVYDTNTLRLITTTYDWYEIKCNKTKDDIIKAFTRLLLEIIYCEDEDDNAVSYYRI